MARLGISVYPEHSTIEKDQAYIRKAGSLGYKRIFTCLLSVGDKSREEVVNEFRALADTAHECGMEIIPDVSPAVFSRLGISYDDLSVFQEMHVDGIRLDEGFDGMKESLMSYNPPLYKFLIKNIVQDFPLYNKLSTTITKESDPIR